MKNWKLYLIVAGSVFAALSLAVFGIQQAPNKAIELEEAVYAAEYDVKTQEKRRVDLLYNLVDCVEQYDTHESDTLISLAEGMSKGTSMEDINTAISAVTYAYPELKSDENYRQLMNELSITENLIGQYRENHNKSIEKYNRFIKKFPQRVFLSWTGYVEQEFKRPEYNAPVDAPQNLFGE